MCKETFRRGIGCALWLGIVLPGLAATEELKPGDSWQERRLLAPSRTQQARESNGQVFIYDGLEQGKVQQAMDMHFDRIENMMFTRIHHLPPTGAGPAEVEDDGCE